MIPGRGQHTGALLAATAQYLREVGVIDAVLASDDDGTDPQTDAAEVFRVIGEVAKDLPEDDYGNVVSVLVGQAFLRAVAADLREDRRRAND